MSGVNNPSVKRTYVLIVVILITAAGLFAGAKKEKAGDKPSQSSWNCEDKIDGYVNMGLEYLEQKDGLCRAEFRENLKDENYREKLDGQITKAVCDNVTEDDFNYGVGLFKDYLMATFNDEKKKKIAKDAKDFAVKKLNQIQDVEELAESIDLPEATKHYLLGQLKEIGIEKIDGVWKIREQRDEKK
jgi:hypothetical protein